MAEQRRDVIGEEARGPDRGPEQPRERLEAKGVSVQFQGVWALQDVDLHFDRGEILGLIGPNGAGKTTLVNVITGYQPAIEGEVTIDSRRATGWRTQRMVRAGVVRTFQNVRPFAGMTVMENVQVGAVGVGVPPRRARRFARELLSELDLAGHADRYESLLSSGEERRLSVARALAASPRFLLLDEPAAGLNEAETTFLVDALSAVREKHGCGMLVIEHDMTVVMRLCERVQVLDAGRSIKVGRPEEVRRDPVVLEAYLGTAGEEEARAEG